MAVAKSGCLSTSARILALLCAALMTLTLPLTLIANAWTSVLFSPQEIASILVEEVMETEAVRTLVVESIFQEMVSQPEGSESSAAGGYFRYLDPGQSMQIIELLLPDTWAREQIQSITDQFYLWIDNDQPAPTITINVDPIRDRLLGGGISRTVELVVDSWPTCTLDQVEELQAAMTRGEDPLLSLCEPPEPIRSDLIHEAERSLTQQTRAMPSIIPLSGNGERDRSPEETLQLKENLQGLRSLGKTAWLLPLSLLGVILSLAVRSLAQLSRWWGWPLVSSGSLTFLLGLLSPGLGSRFIRQGLTDPGVPPVVSELLVAIGEGIVQAVQERILFLSLVIGAAGLILVGLGFFLIRPRSG